WETTWQPTNPSQVTMHAAALQATGNAGILSGDAYFTVTVKSGGKTPVVNSGVLNAASLIPNPVVAPGGLITVKGTGLSDQTNANPNVPYDTVLGHTQLYLDDSPLALLYASDGQINAQVPYDLAPDVQHQLKVQRSDALSIPVD